MFNFASSSICICYNADRRQFPSAPSADASTMWISVMSQRRRLSPLRHRHLSRPQLRRSSAPLHPSAFATTQSPSISLYRLWDICHVCCPRRSSASSTMMSPMESSRPLSSHFP
ncbi:precorrin-6A/cobalt-precorrin-6A reductase [Sesbania bispinosa]|nr:precorrin-6A/cobalt-precorrin-6A reductase [Sesbania bispinosa]